MRYSLERYTLVRYTLERFILESIRAQSTAGLMCIRLFLAWCHTNKQLGDPRTSLLLTGEKAVFYNNDIEIGK